MGDGTHRLRVNPCVKDQKSQVRLQKLNVKNVASGLRVETLLTRLSRVENGRFSLSIACFWNMNEFAFCAAMATCRRSSDASELGD